MGNRADGLAQRNRIIGALRKHLDLRGALRARRRERARDAFCPIKHLGCAAQPCEHRLCADERSLGLRACIVQPPKSLPEFAVEPSELAIGGMLDAILDLAHAVKPPREFALNPLHLLVHQIFRGFLHRTLSTARDRMQLPVRLREQFLRPREHLLRLRRGLLAALDLHVKCLQHSHAKTKAFLHLRRRTNRSLAGRALVVQARLEMYERHLRPRNQIAQAISGAIGCLQCNGSCTRRGYRKRRSRIDLFESGKGRIVVMIVGRRFEHVHRSQKASCHHGSTARWSRHAMEAHPNDEPNLWTENCKLPSRSQRLSRRS